MSNSRTHENVTREVTIRRGVRVEVQRFKDGGSVVLATCNCFGYPFRTHSTTYCPNVKVRP